MISSENLIPLGMLSYLVKPPSALQTQACKQVYMDVSEQYRFDKFEFRGDTALMADQNQRVFEIRSDQVSYRDESSSCSYLNYKEEAVELFTKAQQALNIPVWLVQTFILRMLAPLSGSEQNAPQMLLAKMFSFENESFRVFERPLAGATMKFVFPPHPQARDQYEVRIEPFFRDTKMIYIEVNGRFLEPTNDGNELSARMQASYDFLCERTVPFIQASLSS